MTKKIVIIEDCSECPHLQEDLYDSWCGKDAYEIDEYYLIPDNCPLEDYEEE